MSDRRPEPTEAKGDALIHERASATPHAPQTNHAPSRAREAGAAAATKPRAEKPPNGRRSPQPVKAPLRALQRWFAEVIMHDGTLREGVRASRAGAALGVSRAGDLSRLVTAGPELSALERMAVYHYAYRARLVEVLADDYPSVAHAIGHDAFEALCHAYVKRHPSTSPNLNHFGRHMESFCKKQKAAWRHFAADLASLEWAMVEAIHAPDAAVLSLEALAAIPTERWAEARLPKSDSLRLVHARFPVNRYLQAIRDGESPGIPGREESATAVYRNGKRIWRMDLTREMAALLVDLFDGKTLGEALAAVEEHATSPDALAEAERNVMIWFRAWVEGGFFARVDFTRPRMQRERKRERKRERTRERRQA